MSDTTKLERKVARRHAEMLAAHDRWARELARYHKATRRLVRAEEALAEAESDR